jgi:hypothetical protein
MLGDPSFSAHQEQGESGQEGMDSTLPVVRGASTYPERDSKDLSISLDWFQQEFTIIANRWKVL